MCDPHRNMADLTRFWFEFDPAGSSKAKMSPRWGVTAWTLEDARALITDTGYFGQELPQIRRCVEA